MPTFGEVHGITHYIVYASMALLGILSLFYVFLFGKFKLPKTAFLTPLFVVFTLIGTLLYSHDFRAFLSLIILCISFFIFLIVYNIVGFRAILIAISAGITLFSLVFIVAYRKDLTNVSLLLSGKLRLGFRFDNPNGIGAYEFLCFASSLYVLLNEKKKWRFLFALPILLAVLVGFSTGSKTFFFSIFIFVLIVLFFKFKRRWIYLLSVVLVIGAGVALLYLPFLSTLRQRIFVSLGTFFGSGNEVDSSTIIRSVWFDYGLYIGSRHLLFGTGSNGFAIFSGLGTYAHSNYVEVLCDFGLLGFLIFYLQLIFLFLNSLKIKNINKSFVVAFFIYYLIVGFSTVFYYKKLYFLMLALMCSIVDFELDSCYVFAFSDIPVIIKDRFILLRNTIFPRKTVSTYLDLMYITNNPAVALIAEKCGVSRIWIDLEQLGKEERQKGLNTVKSHHELSDIIKVKQVLSTSKLLVRVNPINPNSKIEIETAIKNGADLIMLPMWKSVDEVKKFVSIINGRVKVVLLLETKEAAQCLDEVLLINGIDEIHIGLNDLHLSYKLKFMFELLSNGTVELLCKKISNKGIKYGFGGISHLGDGLLPSEYIIAEHYRLGSSQAILSRGFCPCAFENNKDEFEALFEKNIKELRAYEQTVKKWSIVKFFRNKHKINKIIKGVVSK